MIGIDDLVTHVSGLQARDVQRWIDNDWIRPSLRADVYVFHDIDVARVKLICEMRDDMQINEDALPVVLSLLDQLYALRRRMRDLSVVLDRLASDELRDALAREVVQNRNQLD